MRASHARAPSRRLGTQSIKPVLRAAVQVTFAIVIRAVVLPSQLVGRLRRFGWRRGRHLEVGGTHRETLTISFTPLLVFRISCSPIQFRFRNSVHGAGTTERESVSSQHARYQYLKPVPPLRSATRRDRVTFSSLTGSASTCSPSFKSSFQRPQRVESR